MDKAGLKQKAIHEFREYLTVLLFLAPLFAALSTYRMLLQGRFREGFLRVRNCPDQRPDPVQDHSVRRVSAGRQTARKPAADLFDGLQIFLLYRAGGGVSCSGRRG